MRPRRLRQILDGRAESLVALHEEDISNPQYRKQIFGRTSRERLIRADLAGQVPNQQIRYFLFNPDTWLTKMVPLQLRPLQRLKNFMS